MGLKIGNQAKLTLARGAGHNVRLGQVLGRVWMGLAEGTRPLVIESHKDYKWAAEVARARLPYGLHLLRVGWDSKPS
ncbi:hypothetical protein SDJN03_17223, partial [Cucurbita argyrosperma subsp. sororia]